MLSRLLWILCAASLLVQKTVSFWSSITLGSYTLYTPSSEPWEKGEWYPLELNILHFKKFLNSFYIPATIPPPIHPPAPPSAFPLPHPFLQKHKASYGESKESGTFSRGRTKPLPSASRLNKVSPLKNVLKKPNSRSRNRSWSHYQRPPQTDQATQPSHTAFCILFYF